MSPQHFLVERRAHVAVVTLNRPGRANAVTYEVLRELEEIALAFREDAETRAVVFTGARPHFCSGMDLKDASGYGDSLVIRRRRTRIGARAMTALMDMDQITIAAWTGAAMGGGACFATALDFRIGATDCFMQYPEVDIGMNLMWQSLPLCVHLVGPARAKRLVVGGERIHGPTLAAWGVLDECVPVEDVLPRALAMAAFYAGKPPVAAQMIKRSINRISAALDGAIMHMDADQNLYNRTMQDQAEAIEAYLAKREPKFTGD
ncbi:MAG: enoyl-CoA hydratase/isomerase family protein [Gammaproteobacteria bacterium]|nr:enoyl-CoA hydratase/isomerase family protein [Gammaproteobacteria bacterium]MBI5615058.1 enoyl-CoA hydratase/isomerase family protein [Gammaproteobacteria bacterium]